MSTWQLQEAKARLSEVIQLAESEGPQVITRRGVQTAVVVPYDAWERMNQWSRTTSPAPVQAPAKPLSNEELLKFLQSAPDFEIPDRHSERLKRSRRRSA